MWQPSLRRSRCRAGWAQAGVGRSLAGLEEFGVRERGALAVDILYESVIRAVVGMLPLGAAAGGCSLREATDEGAGCMSLRVVSMGTMLRPCCLREGMSE